MSEPVGNSPRKKPDTPNSMSSITGNSHKNRDEPAETAGGREPITKIVEGNVVSRKQPMLKRLRNTMIADDVGNVGEYILTDIIVPATKNLIVDMVGQTIERLLFGTSRGRLRRSPLGASLRDQVNYGRISTEPRRVMSREARARHDFNEIVLENRTEAIEVLEALVDRIARYGAVTVADLYDFVGTTGSFADQRWGWTDLTTADVRQVPGGFLLDLPGPEPVR